MRVRTRNAQAVAVSQAGLKSIWAPTIIGAGLALVGSVDASSRNSAWADTVFESVPAHGREPRL
jgi:hypothetical protein